MKSASHGSHGEMRRTILFGAFDRHNLGDLLLAHCAALRCGQPVPVCAGLVTRDMRRYGGHYVQRLDALIARLGEQSVNLIHVGGEVLTTTAWEAAVMLQSPAEAARAIALHDHCDEARDEWARRVLGDDRPLPYVVPAHSLPHGWSTHFRAVGGVALARLPNALRKAALDALCEATTVSVRDTVTLAELHKNGIPATLEPDPVSALEPDRLFSARPPARSPDIAVQIASEWGDDASLDLIANTLSEAAQRLDAGITFFRAGIAPWHDNLDTLRRLAHRLPQRTRSTIFASVHIADICRLLAGARGYVGTSLHAWIVAQRFGVPATCLVRDAEAKAAAYLDTWHPCPRRWRIAGERLLN